MRRTLRSTGNTGRHRWLSTENLSVNPARWDAPVLQGPGDVAEKGLRSAEIEICLSRYTEWLEHGNTQMSRGIVVFPEPILNAQLLVGPPLGRWPERGSKTYTERSTREPPAGLRVDTPSRDLIQCAEGDPKAAGSQFCVAWPVHHAVQQGRQFSHSSTDPRHFVSSILSASSSFFITETYSSSQAESPKENVVPKNSIST